MKNSRKDNSLPDYPTGMKKSFYCHDISLVVIMKFHYGETFRKIPNESSKWRERWLYDKCRHETLDDSLWEKKKFSLCAPCLGSIYQSYPKSVVAAVPESRNDGSWWVWLEKCCFRGHQMLAKIFPFFMTIGLSFRIVKSFLEIFLIWYSFYGAFFEENNFKLNSYNVYFQIFTLVWLKFEFIR